MGLSVAFISVDAEEGVAETNATYEVPFPLLSDATAEVHDAYKVTNQLDAAGVERLKGFGIEVDRWSKRKHHKIAIPAIFLIGKDKKVKWAHAAKDYRTRPDFEQLVTALGKVAEKK